MAGTRGINGTAIFVSLVGAVLAYSGVTGKKITTTVRGLIAGNIATAPADYTYSNSGGSGGTGAAGFTGSAPNPAVTSGGGSFDQIKTYVLALSFSKAGAAGALGNISVETGGTYSSTSFNANEGAIGFCQWELGRRTALQAFAKAHGSTETDPAMQLGYMRAELLSAFADVYLYMRGATDPGSAAAYWDERYERSAGTSRQERIDRARQIYASM